MENLNVESLIIDIVQCTNGSQEYALLGKLLQFFKYQPYHLCSPTQQEDLEKLFLEKLNLSEIEISSFPSEILKKKSLLNVLTFYIFRRRFGWSEISIIDCHEKSVSDRSRTPGQQTPSPSNFRCEEFDKLNSRNEQLPFIQESELKTKLNAILDDFIQIYASEEIISCPTLEAYKYALKKAHGFAVVRSQLLCHVFQWFSMIISETTIINDEEFILVKLLTVSGVTDIWSAIRISCIAKLPVFIQHFTIQQLKDIFQTLIEMCHRDDDLPWQTKEGAIMAIGKILQCFKFAAVPSSVFGRQEISAGAVICQKFGNHHFKLMPSFITEPLQKVIYKLLSSNQLSIREHANKAFSYFLLRSEFPQVFKSFKDVLLHLAKEALSNIDSHTKKIKFSDASHVEGFLRLAEFLIRQIPIQYILNSWQFCFATFSYYLMHPASTIRQASSSVFKYLVAKQTSNLLLPIKAITSLILGWKTDVASLKDCKVDEKFKGSLPPQRSSIQCLQMKSIDEVSITELWEWREGRLLAYELILKFLITNHIHYTFPAHTITHATDQKISPSLEHANKHQKLSVSHNFGSPAKTSVTTRHEGLSRSLTMECDPITQQLISSLASKEKLTDQTSSLLEAFKKKDKFASSFDDLNDEYSSGYQQYCQITEKLVADFEALSMEKTQLCADMSLNEEDFSFGRILIQIFIQTLESLDDARWELRRMACQVLPLISESIRFYDAKILENFWKSCLSVNASKLTFGACLSLKDSVTHAARLVKYFEKPPGFWKDVDRCRIAAGEIVAIINEGLFQLLIKVAAIIQRQSLDKLTIVAMEVLILSAINFPQTFSHNPVLSDVINKLASLFVQAFPQDDYATYITEKLHLKIGKLDIPRKGFLSCIAKGSSTGTTIEQVQGFFYLELQNLLPSFIRHVPGELTILLLPIIIKEIQLLIETSLDVAQLFQTCHEILKYTTSVLNESIHEHDDKCKIKDLENIKEVLHHACISICHLIQTKTLELHFLRNCFDLLLSIVRIVKSNEDIKTIFNAIFSMLSSDDALLNISDTLINKNDSNEEFLRIRLLSNDIRQSPIDRAHNTCDDDDYDGTERNLFESQALYHTKADNIIEELTNASSSNANTDSSYQDDSDSDWDDDWEDTQEQDESDHRHIIESFLASLREIITAYPKDTLHEDELGLFNRILKHKKLM
eukprot:gene18804-20698_t